MSIRVGINSDERRAKNIARDHIIHQETPILITDEELRNFESKWLSFLKEGARFDKPKNIANEFIRRWQEL